MNQDSRVVGIALALLVAGGGAWFLWRHQQTPPPTPAPTPTQPVAPVIPPAPDTAPEPAIRHPIEPAAARPAARPLPALGESDDYVKNALQDLLGRQAVLSFFNIDGFVRGFVATVDNLANERPQTQLWPVKPTPGQFQTEPGAGDAVISARNAERYAPLVRLVDGVDTSRAVALYRRLYPLFQQAYEELGYPGKYFNDRVVQVIDHLLATPEIPGPIPLKRIEVEGQGAGAGAGTKAKAGGLFQFADPRLEARSAGQKILLRVGSDNADKLKQKLAEVREQITRR